MSYRLALASLLSTAAITTAFAAPAPSYSVQFNSSYNQAANPNLVFTDADVQADGLHTYYGSSGASTVSLSNALLSGSEYTVSLSFTGISRTDYTRKVLDFGGLTSDAGIYVNDGAIAFSNATSSTHADVSGAAGVLAPFTSFNFTLTRSAASNIVVGYVNGLEQFSFQDTAGQAVFSSALKSIYILTDNNDGYEITPGVLKGINVYNTALSPADFGGSISAVPEPESYALCLAGLMTLGYLMKRRRG